ncbi:DUF4136 domain-containing protein [Belliella sp. DSM 111904]|uniref:DUF4136 domain-containing protein n=1 Tax=Belliella filtrata TaxID=2923435 RepID=A0ABS9V1K0_9BACT|nr:DUF4136 domain-containing protein [Belliella filtrata]MCH7410094.1 DUF4136 domain-containing protein [Belliella filtrata]
MKNFTTLSMVLLLFAVSCVTQKDYIAEYDFNYSANFKRYKTFGFVDNPDDNEDFEVVEIIRRSISNRLGSQGFRFQETKPDLLVNYKVYREEVKYRGYDQPNFDYWLQRKSYFVAEDEEEISDDKKEKDENYNKVKYAQNDGMLVVFVIDNKRGNTVWQGYTSGLFDNSSPEMKTDLTRATYKVMDQFRILTKN